MKKLVIVYVVLIIAVILLAVFKAGSIGSILHLGGASAEINGNKVNLSVVKNEKDRMKGLSGKKNLSKDSGMLFVFDKKDRYTFWMNGMLFSIDMVFIDDNTVVDIFENLPVPDKNTPQALLPRYTSESPANYVLEIKAGDAKKLKIEKGTKVNFKGL